MIIVDKENGGWCLLLSSEGWTSLHHRDLRVLQSSGKGGSIFHKALLLLELSDLAQTARIAWISRLKSGSIRTANL